jgi:hypothetical protein
MAARSKPNTLIDTLETRRPIERSADAALTARPQRADGPAGRR